MTQPVFDTSVYPPVSSWGVGERGNWCDKEGVPRDRSYWKSLVARGRPPALPENLWDTGKELRLLWHAGAVKTSEVASQLGLTHRTTLRFLNYQVLWWL